jgi:ABC-type sugar transport system substrate-binding protein
MRSKNFSIGLMALLAIFIVTLFTTATPAVAQETVLYTFGVTYTDADSPFAGLISDAQGNLYGTAFGGGANNAGACSS